jgi:multiple sugar transport system permease protein
VGTVQKPATITERVLSQAVGRAISGRPTAGFLFLLPAVLWILAFTIFPLVYAIYTSLHSYRFGRISGFVGLTNFERLLRDSNLHSTLVVTIQFVIAAVAVEMILGFALALLVHREFRLRGLVRTAMILPLFATPVAIGYLAITLFYERNGPVNLLLHTLLGLDIPWLSHPQWALISVILVDIWQWTPFVFLISLAALQSLPDELYEAAQIDGAGSLGLLRHITLPLMAPTLWLILLLRLVEAFKVFDIPVSLTLGGPGRATEVFSLFTYRTAMRFFDFGYAAAQGFLLLAIVMSIITLLFRRIQHLYQQ